MPALTRTIAAAAAIASLAAAAPATAAHHPSQATPPDISDATFLAKSSQSNRFEIASGALAVQRGRSRAVRRLGRQFRVHHTMALAQGSAVAEKLGIAVPAGLDAKQQATVDRLGTLRGKRFDRVWLKAQKIAHTDAIVLHLRGALRGDSDDVRTLAIKALPVVAQHLGELDATR